MLWFCASPLSAPPQRNAIVLDVRNGIKAQDGYILNWYAVHSSRHSFLGHYFSFLLVLSFCQEEQVTGQNNNIL